MINISYPYFVSYKTPTGFGMIELSMAKEVEDYDDILKMTNMIEKDKDTKDKPVVISNYIRLKYHSAEMLKRIQPKKICPNKDANGNCPLHNLHCQFPDCEKY